jgi:hypothetical protein
VPLRQPWGGTPRRAPRRSSREGHRCDFERDRIIADQSGAHPLDLNQNRNHHFFDPQNNIANGGGRLQIGTLAGFVSVRVAGSKLGCMAGFVGIRKPTGVGLPHLIGRDLRCGRKIIDFLADDLCNHVRQRLECRPLLVQMSVHVVGLVHLPPRMPDATFGDVVGHLGAG